MCITRSKLMNKHLTEPYIRRQGTVHNLVVWNIKSTLDSQHNPLPTFKKSNKIETFVWLFIFFMI